jgi:2',3'-cyclic-nucleotide 2'-phosphodiesterase (5'-nucleotidase family)
MKKVFLIALMTWSLLILGGCDWFNSSVKLTVPEESIPLEVSQTYQIVPTISSDDEIYSVVYFSNNNDVASVTTAGIITGKAEGVAIISAVLSKNGAVTTTKATITVTVTEAGNPTENDVINIFTLNDFHGAIFQDGDEAGISRIGAYLMAEKAANPDSTVIVSAGDMFQGTAVSSMTRGSVVVRAMNAIGFDAMTIGNHEFDWGISGITRFNDGNLANDEADFPLLGANIEDSLTSQLASWSEPYTVIERGELKIGIIGLIGEDEKSDILASVVADYEFTSQMTAIRTYAPILRTTEDCDIVIVSSHDDTSNINAQIADLTGDYQVDAVVNGHTHRYYAGEQSGIRDVPLPYVQSGNNGNNIGKISLEIDPETKTVIDVSAENISTYSNCTVESPVVNGIINEYSAEIAIAGEVLGTAGETIEKDATVIWAAETIKQRGNTQVGIVNYGGIRGAAFPIYQNATVTFANIFKIMPFENTVITMSLTGAQLIQLMGTSLHFSRNVDPVNLTIDGIAIASGNLYTVSTMDFVFEGYPNIFGNAQSVVYTNDLFRDYLVAEVRESVETNGSWILNN